MRAREQTYTTSELLRVQAEIRRARRAEKVWTVAAVVVLIALVVLCGWLWSLIRAGIFTGDNGGNGGLNSKSLLPLFSPVPNLGLAMAPVWQESIMGLLAFLIMFAGVLVVVRQGQEEEGRRQEAGGTRPELDLHDPFYGITDGLDGDEMHRILTSCAAEGREIKRLVKHALTSLDIEDGEDALEVAYDRLTTLIACVEALCERLNPEFEQETTKRTEKGGAES